MSAVTTDAIQATALQSVQYLSSIDPSRWHQIYDAIRPISNGPRFPGDFTKNRYDKIQCGELRRVTLRNFPDDQNYIHANEIAYALNRKIIITQTPMFSGDVTGKVSTAADYWTIPAQMDEPSLIIHIDVDMTGLLYPTTAGKVQIFTYGTNSSDGISVRYVNSVNHGQVLMKSLAVQQQGYEERAVDHCTLPNWPLGSLPPYDILDEYIELMMTSSTIIVNCQNGIKRSGTLVFIFLLAYFLRNGYFYPPHSLLIMMRTFCPNCIPTAGDFLRSIKYIIYHSRTVFPAYDFIPEQTPLVQNLKAFEQACDREDSVRLHHSAPKKPNTIKICILKFLVHSPVVGVIARIVAMSLFVIISGIIIFAR